MRITTRRSAAIVLAAGLGGIFAVAAIAAGQAGPGYKKIGGWGKVGTANGQFGNNAFGLAVDSAGNVYVADSDNHRVQMFSATGGFRRAFPFDPAESVQDVAVGRDGAAWATALQTGEARRLGGDETLATDKQAIGIAIDAGGNVYVSTAGDNIANVSRYDKASGYAKGKTLGGLRDPHDVEVSQDGSVYVVDGLTVKRFVADKLVKTIRGGASGPIGIAVDLDCNLWMTNIAQRNLTKVSPTGKVLGTAATPDLIAQDVAVGPKGDLYAFDGGTQAIVRLAEDRTKPASAVVGGNVTVANGVAKLKYTLSGVACPAEISGVASLSGAVKGKASVKVAAGKTTVISIPVKGSKGSAQFKIVLKTNGRPTTQTAEVRLG